MRSAICTQKSVAGLRLCFATANLPGILRTGEIPGEKAACKTDFSSNNRDISGGWQSRGAFRAARRGAVAGAMAKRGLRRGAERGCVELGSARLPESAVRSRLNGARHPLMWARCQVTSKGLSCEFETKRGWFFARACEGRRDEAGLRWRPRWSGDPGARCSGGGCCASPVNSWQACRQPRALTCC